VVAAIDIAHFGDPEAYCQNVDGLIDEIKALPCADGFDEVLVPGEMEDRVHEMRAAEGIPLPDGTWRNLQEVSARLGVALPEVVA
jgi:LDH2 family malate/lactate/ureidoglycolate dehydrogenase